MREELAEMLISQIIGLAATVSVARNIPLPDAVAEYAKSCIRRFAQKKPEDFEAKRTRAKDRYVFYNNRDSHVGGI